MSRLNSPFWARNTTAYARLASVRQRIWATSLPELFVLLLAALPRLWRLEYHSVWFDEAISLDWAKLGPAHIWPGTFQLIRDKHPPAYYLALHYWQTLLGWFGADRSDRRPAHLRRPYRDSHGLGDPAPCNPAQRPR